MGGKNRRGEGWGQEERGDRRGIPDPLQMKSGS